MWDPNHPHIFENMMQEVEPPPNDNSEEEEEEEGDGDDVAGADNERPGTTSGLVMHDNDGNGIVRSTAPSSPPEVVILDDMHSEDGGDVVVEVKRECNSQRKGVNVGKGGSTASLNGDDDEVTGEFNRGEIDGLFCPICYEAWSSGGDHHIWYALCFVYFIRDCNEFTSYVFYLDNPLYFSVYIVGSM